MLKNRPHVIGLSIVLVLLLAVTGVVLSCAGDGAGETPTPTPTLGLFTDVTSTNLPEDSDDSIPGVLGDVDGDGDLDIFFGNIGQQNSLYLNNGAGVFTDATSTNLPEDSDRSGGVLGDVDGDGDLDIFLANSFYTEGQQNRLYLNDGDGVFTDATSTNLPEDSDLSIVPALGDVDGDEDLDIFFTNHNQQNKLYLNNGAGNFTDATSTNLPEDSDPSNAVVLGDVDGDEDLDIIFANHDQQNKLYLNDGSGVFTDATSTNLPEDSDSSVGPDLGDVDGDGDLDILITNCDGQQNKLYLNNGNGVFIDATSTNLPVDSDDDRAGVLGDVDGDEDLDIISGNYGQQNKLYLNDGGGVFTDATSTNLPADSDNSIAPALGDVDGDGDLDIFFGNLGQQNRLYLNLTK